MFPRKYICIFSLLRKLVSMGFKNIGIKFSTVLRQIIRSKQGRRWLISQKFLLLRSYLLTSVLKIRNIRSEKISNLISKLKRKNLLKSFFRVSKSFERILTEDKILFKRGAILKNYISKISLLLTKYRDEKMEGNFSTKTELSKNIS